LKPTRLLAAALVALLGSSAAAQTPAPLTREQADEQYPRYKVELFEDASPSLGPSHAPVTIAMVMDFQCPFCARAASTIRGLKDQYGERLRLVFHNNPLAFHKQALPAAEAALAAHLQGRFWEYHDKLFANTRALGEPDLERYAEEIGLRIGIWKHDRESPRLREQIKQEQAQATRLGARGTPSFFINGRYLPGAQPPAKFESVIELELTAARELMSRGVSASDVYRELTRDALTEAKPRARRPTPSHPREDPDKIHDVPVGDAPTLGGPNAAVTIAVFTDYQCPYCGRLEPTLEQINDKYGSRVQIAWKHLPLPFHKRALPAARAAVAAQRQGRFYEYHRKLFDNHRKLEDSDLERYAREIGLDIRRFRRDLDSGSVDAAVESDQGLAGRIGARGTPTSYVNGRKVSGAQPFESFRKLIDEELKKRGLPY